MQFLKGGVPLDGEKRETGALVVNLRRRRGLEKWALGCCPANGARAFRRVSWVASGQAAQVQPQP
ncbi:MAG TPA: hypothetical protein VHT48_07675 [Methylocella sp.]|jgi:hypothetical protein|nr:hypothetical protein [Methylocella sp.]